VSACSNSDVAATVNDSVIDNEDVTALRNAPIGETISGELYRGDLTTLIIAQATLDAAEHDYGITGLDTDTARSEYVEAASASELEIVSSVRENPDLSEAAVDVVVTQLAVRAAVAEEITKDPEVLERVWQEQQRLLVEVCARHILVASEAEALAAKERIEAGEDFTSVANELSLDTFSPGGQLPCPANPTDFVEPFATVVAATQLGELTDPFETEFGWHIVIVDDRVFPASYDEFVAAAQRWVPEAVVFGAWSNWRDAALASAEIEVRSQIGRWFPQGDGILPPPASP
jgi:parvulin-like peptidyl-prolyl isomerase